MSAPLGWVREAAGELPAEPGAGLADGSRAAGVNPADIYAWFHDGPGTGGYQRARDTLGLLAAGFAEYARLARDTPLAGAAGSLLLHATVAENSVAGQIIAFNDTALRVAPARLPGGAELTRPFAPDSHTADAAVAGYQRVAQDNRDAYAGYQSRTAAQGQALPQ